MIGKLPEKLGFELGLIFHVAEPASIKNQTPAALLEDVVYVAVSGDEVVKVGETSGSLLERWNGIRGIFGTRQLKPTEEKSRREWLEAVGGKDVAVWVRKAGRFTAPYMPDGFSGSTRNAEEEALDHYYKPTLGNGEWRPER